MPHLTTNGGSGAGTIELARATISSIVVKGSAENSAVSLRPFSVVTTMEILILILLLLFVCFGLLVCVILFYFLNINHKL